MCLLITETNGQEVSNGILMQRPKSLRAIFDDAPFEMRSMAGLTLISKTLNTTD